MLYVYVRYTTHKVLNKAYSDCLQNGGLHPGDSGDPRRGEGAGDH